MLDLERSSTVPRSALQRRNGLYDLHGRLLDWRHKVFGWWSADLRRGSGGLRYLVGSRYVFYRGVRW